RPRSWSTCGTPMTRPSSTWSRCTPATCDARSTRRSGGVRCRRCAAPATDWPLMAGDTGLRWWRRLGLRARLTLIAPAGLAVALTVAALLLLGELQSSLTREVDSNARQAATEIANLADARELPRLLPFGAGTLSVQVLDAQGRVTRASAQGDRLVPLLPAAVARSIARSGRVVQMPGGPIGIAAPLRVVAVPAINHQIVVAAVSYAQVSDSLAAVTREVVFGAPLLFLRLATAPWLVAGAALRPIEKLRRGAQEISDTAIARTLPV